VLEESMSSSEALGFAGLHHVSLRVENLERSLALYRDTLGFRLEVSFILHDWRFAWLDTPNGGCLELVEVKRPARSGSDDDVVWHFALRTRELEQAFEAVRRAGYTITREITPLALVNTTTGRPMPVRVAFFRGPDGEDVELIEDPGAEA
jgi:catechol 2,3-dioxygenase-like lactoylglutathione lyase family enzyme